MSALAPLMEAFFTDRLINQCGASANTIAGYRDTFRLLLGFAADRTGKKPSGLDIADLDAPLIAAFLDHLEHERGNQVRTRNNRLAAIHSMFSYAALRHPEHAATIQRVLAIPAKRCDRNLVELLQEVRVVQTGVQVLFAFLLTAPLAARFPELSPFQRSVYFVR